MQLSKIILKNWLLYKRDFSWRKNPDEYKIVIAEFMLQRTKANQVEPIYKKFLKQYPTIQKLANAQTKSIEKYTLSLGLHGRAKNFKDATKFILKNYNGEIPDNREELLRIPGVGDYVAGAILTVCFNKREYVIDSNIARFINRYYGLGLTGEIRRKKIIIEKAKELFNYKNTRDLLFAILDFTALVCKPQKPECNICPLRNNCEFFNIRN